MCGARAICWRCGHDRQPSEEVYPHQRHFHLRGVFGHFPRACLFQQPSAGPHDGHPGRRHLLQQRRLPGVRPGPAVPAVPIRQHHHRGDPVQHPLLHRLGGRRRPHHPHQHRFGVLHQRRTGGGLCPDRPVRGHPARLGVRLPLSRSGNGHRLHAGVRERHHEPQHVRPPAAHCLSGAAGQRLPHPGAHHNHLQAGGAPGGGKL